jgi:PAS domain S-box-containing protein
MRDLLPKPNENPDTCANELRASELRYRRLFESAKDGILILDAETGMIVDVNPFLTDLLGYSHAEFLGKKIWDLGFFRNLAANARKFADLQASAYSRYDNLPLETADGRKIEVEFVSNVYLSDGLKVIQCNIRDITARNRAAEALRESERLAQATVDALSAHIAVLDEVGTILAVNRAWRGFAVANPPLTHTVNEGAHYLSVCDAATGPDSGEAAAVAAGIRAVMSGSQSMFELEYPCHSPETQRWFVCRVSRFQGADAVRVVVAHEDITTRRQAEDELHEQMTELQRWYEVTLGREGRVLEIKQEVNALLSKAGQPPRYPLAADSIV